MAQYRLVSRDRNDIGFLQVFPDRQSMLDHALTVIATLGRDKFTLDQDYPEVKIETSYRVWNYQKIES